MIPKTKTPAGKTKTRRPLAKRLADNRAAAQAESKRLSAKRPAARKGPTPFTAETAVAAGVTAAIRNRAAAVQAGETNALQPVTSAAVTAGGFITVAALAAELGAAHETIQKRARALGVTKMGKTYLINAAQAAQIRAALSNPKKEGPKTRLTALAEAAK